MRLQAALLITLAASSVILAKDKTKTAQRLDDAADG